MTNEEDGSADLTAYAPRRFPPVETLDGRSVALEPIVDESRFTELWDAFSKDSEGRIWDWLAGGPFADFESFSRYGREAYLAAGHRFYAFVPRESGRAEGVAALFRADLGNGVIELGHICLAPSLQRTVAASEGFFLLMELVLGSLGYRRLEWKCNDGNQGSKRAAARLGFTYEGLFRQHMIVKGHNRDTAWFSLLDREWPAQRKAFQAWLSPDNLDADGRQLRSLRDFGPSR
ncbi:Protein N-acetyltransferase, RimJ/RimL family [Fulvimarina manganoxydans]|uniref:Protein N-acetyltransferase, RimJ/RimL family n=1 Tax=Fulvimarina manganoxydans TaxID=937218 RepID=A0A1W2DMN9_9HYPH|nr:GNAT family protein [Fulvimarina manganoxydans]SMC98667.1 Protein N-acetyltransferase, RimJ/RimL family [Fulvimarina manganoxydans]